jgi:hypothetical protein
MQLTSAAFRCDYGTGKAVCSWVVVVQKRSSRIHSGAGPAGQRRRRAARAATCDEHTAMLFRWALAAPCAVRLSAAP